MAKKISYDEDCRANIVAGIDAVADAVRVTLGPKGRNVVLEREYGVPEIVNDGVTIAREVSLEDAEMDVGVKLLQQVAQQTDIKAGDGTTTSTVLTQSMARAGLKAVASGAEPMGVKRGIMKASTLVVEELQRLSRPVESNGDVLNTATISSGSEEFGAIIAEAFERVGELGTTVIENGQSIEDTVEYSEGLELDRGYLSPYFITDPEREVAELQAARVLVTDCQLNSMQQLLPILEPIVQAQLPLLIVAENIDGEALSSLLLNKERGVLNVVAIKAPGFGDSRKQALQDICLMTGAVLVSAETGLSMEQVSFEMLGKSDRVVAGKASTTIVATSETQEAVKEKIQAILTSIDTMETDREKRSARQRISILGGGIARIKVGADTETELKDKLLRYEDAVNAVKAAKEMGVVAGGGAALIHASKKWDEWTTQMAGEDELTGLSIVVNAMKSPMLQIATNAGVEGALIQEKVKEADYPVGYNAASDCLEDLLAAGVMDPTKVTIWGVQNACSIVAQLLTTEAVITEIPQPEKQEAPAPAGPGPMGF